MMKVDNYLEKVNSVAITGHIKPDGDCIGSCLALYNYILFNYPEINVKLYLEEFSQKYMFLPNSDKVIHDYQIDEEFDLFIVLDTGNLARIGGTVRAFHNAKATLSIDHHVSNENYSKDNIVYPDASSASEVLYELIDENKINQDIAQCIYTGIVYDTGVFKHSNTSEKTMQIAGKLMSYGIPFSKIIDSSFYLKTYNQNLISGRAMLDSKLAFNGKCIYTVLTKKHMREFDVTSKELDGIVDQIRVVDGVECAIFLYEINKDEYKVSFRSNDYVDVNKAAGEFGGGGHIRAAGCSISGEIDDIIKQLLDVVKKQI